MTTLIRKIPFLVAIIVISYFLLQDVLSYSSSYLEAVRIRISQAKCPGLPQPAPGAPDPYTLIIDGASIALVAIFGYFVLRDIVRERRRRADGREDDSTTDIDGAGEKRDSADQGANQ